MTRTIRILALATLAPLFAGCFGGGDPELVSFENDDLIIGSDDVQDAERDDAPFTATTDCPADETPLACEVIDLVNRERADRGLSPVDYNFELAVAAYRHAEDMSVRGYFDHQSLDGRSFSDRIVEAGYDAFPRAENIAAGYSTAEAVMVGWMNSEGHRANILDDQGNELGVGFYPQGNFWVQNFGIR